MSQALFWALWNTASDTKQNLQPHAADTLLELAEGMKSTRHLGFP